MYDNQGGYASSLYNPVHAANMNPGWGINASLLTPSFQAPYRPSYQGPGAFGPSYQPGFGQSLWNTFGPNPPPMFSNPVDTLASSFDSMSGNVADSAVWVGHRIIAPGLTFAAVNKVMGGNALGFGGLPWKFGKSAGRGLGFGFARGLGAGVGISGGVGAATGVAGGLLASATLPLLATTTLMKGVEWGVEGYNSTRMLTDDFRDSFHGVTFANERFGNVVHGRGMNRSTAAMIGRQVTREGMRDMTFSNEEYSAIASMTARSGLLDDVNPERMTKRIKEVADQVKLIIGISKDPNLQNAIEALARLQLGGASVSGGLTSAASSSYRRLSAFAGAAGQSIQSVVEGVGAQGEYLYRASGMTPYLGQLAAANALASFSTAKRMGLISIEQLARMGGVEGATQSAMQAGISLRNTPLNQLSAYNQHVLGNEGGRTLQEVYSQVASTFSADPLQAFGSMQLYGTAALSAQAKTNEEPLESLMRMLASTVPGLVDPRTGKISAEKTMAVMTGVFGISPEESRAAIAELAARRDPDNQQIRIRALLAEDDMQGRTLVEQEGLHTGLLMGSFHNIRRRWKGMQSRVGVAGSSFSEALSADFGDWLEEKFHGWTSGGSLNERLFINPEELTVDSLFGGSREDTSGNFLRTGYSFDRDLFRRFSDSRNMGEIAEIMNKLSIKDDNARKFLDASTDEERSLYLSRTVNKHRADFGYLAEYLEDNSNFFQFIESAGRDKRTDSIQVESGRDAFRFQEALRKAFPEGNEVQGMRISGAAGALIGRMKGDERLGIGEAWDSLQNDERYAELKTRAEEEGITIRTMSDFLEREYERTDNVGLMTSSRRAYENRENIKRWREDPSLMLHEGARRLMEEAKRSGNDLGKIDQAVMVELTYRGGGSALDSSLKNNVYDQALEDRLARNASIESFDRVLQGMREENSNSIIDAKTFLEKSKRIEDLQLQNEQRKINMKTFDNLEKWEKILDKEEQKAEPNPFTVQSSWNRVKGFVNEISN